MQPEKRGFSSRLTLARRAVQAANTDCCQEREREREREREKRKHQVGLALIYYVCLFYSRAALFVCLFGGFSFIRLSISKFDPV